MQGRAGHRQLGAPSELAAAPAQGACLSRGASGPGRPFSLAWPPLAEPLVTRAEWWKKEGGEMPQRLLALVVSGCRGAPPWHRLPSRPRPRPRSRAESCPRGRWRQGVARAEWELN